MARERGEADLAPEADLEAVEAIIDAAFWASLRREEGYTPTISLAFLPPDQAIRPLTFEPRLSLAPDALARLAPAVKQAGIHLGVWREGGTGDSCACGARRGRCRRSVSFSRSSLRGCSSSSIRTARPESS